MDGVSAIKFENTTNTEVFFYVQFDRKIIDVRANNRNKQDALFRLVRCTLVQQSGSNDILAYRVFKCKKINLWLSVKAWQPDSGKSASSPYRNPEGGKKRIRFFAGFSNCPGRFVRLIVRPFSSDAHFHPYRLSSRTVRSNAVIINHVLTGWKSSTYTDKSKKIRIWRRPRCRGARNRPRRRQNRRRRRRRRLFPTAIRHHKKF